VECHSSDTVNSGEYYSVPFCQLHYSRGYQPFKTWDHIHPVLWTLGQPCYKYFQGYSNTLSKICYKYYWTYGDVLYTDWRENSQSYFHTLQALDMSPTCDATDVKSIIQLFPQSSQHVTGNSSHILSDAPLQIIDIRTLRDFLSIRTQDMDLTSVVFVK
jgi:hypothetical protein